MKNFLNKIEFFSKNSPSNICLQKGQKKITFKEFWDLSLKFSNYLQKKNKK